MSAFSLYYKYPLINNRIIVMTKFFLPKQPGSHYKLHHKKKKQPTNCNETIVNNIFNLLKKDQVKQTLKKIKKIK